MVMGNYRPKKRNYLYHLLKKTLSAEVVLTICGQRRRANEVFDYNPEDDLCKKCQNDP